MVESNKPERKPGGATGKGFMPGKSGNPGGRPKEIVEIESLARSYAPEAIKRLAEWMQSDDPRASVAAAGSLLDRGFGRPRQSMELEIGDKIAHTLEAMRRRRKE